MKKLTAIFLLCTFVLNLVGYRMWYYFELKSADHKMEALLDNQGYLESELITIRIPLTLPYQTDTDDFERIAGEVTFEGKIYKYVKRKMENGHFVLRCLPDHNRMQLEREKNELVKNSLDQSQNNADKPGSGKSLKHIFSEYEQMLTTLNVYQRISVSETYVSLNDARFFSLSVAAPSEPPDNFS